MKRLLKKLTAGAMAGVMALGMVVTAGASSTERSNVAGGTYRGTGGLESGKAANTIKIVLPTFAAADLNMIIDPHSMIALTKGEAWKDNAGRIPTFASDTNIFFRNNVKNTTAQTVTMTGTGATGVTSKAKVFKKVEVATGNVYRTKDPATSGGTDYKWYDTLDATLESTDAANFLEDTVTTLPGQTGKIYVRPVDPKKIAETTALETNVEVIKYEKLTVTGLWLVEDEDDVTKNKAYNKLAATTADADMHTALNGKDIATITNDTNNYVPVPSTEYAYDYSAQSDAFKVINKSHMPLTVSVKAELSKNGDSSNDPKANVTLVDAKTDLVNEKEGKETGALMYLALVNDAEEDPIVMKDAVIEEEGENGAPDKYQIRDISVVRDYTATQLETTGVYNVDLIKGQPVFEWVTDDNDEKIALNEKLSTDGFGSNTNPTYFQVQYDHTKDLFSVSALTGQTNSGSYVAELVMQEPDEDGEVVTEVKGNGVAVPVYVNIKKSASDDEAIARIAMVLDGLKAGKLTGLSATVTSNGPKVALKQWEPQGEAASKASLPVFESGFKLESTPGATPISGMAANQVGASTSTATYAYTVNPDVPDSRFSTAKFSFDAGINTVDGWDLANAGSLRLNLIYSVNQYNAATDPALPEDEEPTVTVTTPGADASINALVMAVTLGTGNSAYDKVTAIKWTPSGGTEKTVAIASSGNNFFDEDALTVTLKYAVTTTANTNMATGTDWKMVFTNDLTNETKEVDFDIHTAGTYPAS